MMIIIVIIIIIDLIVIVKAIKIEVIKKGVTRTGE